MKKLRKVTQSGVALVAITALLVLQIPIPVAHAADLTKEKDLLSTIETSANANHTISWLQTTAITAGQTVVITFPSDFSLTGVAEAAGASDIDLAEDTDGSPTTCTGTLTDETLDTAASATTWGAVVSGQTVTFTAPSNAATYVAAGSCVVVEIGTHATNEFTGVNQINNATTTGSKTITMTSSTADTGTLAVSLVTDESVNVTANVDPSITFTISDTTIEFGTLSASAATWADNAAGSASDVAAHTMGIATNAATGYAITYNGATLTGTPGTISVAAITNDADGTTDGTTEQFAMGFSTSGDATIATGYDHNVTAGSRDWTFVASTTTTIASEIVPTATETISAFYLANIATTTEPGSYSTNITYIATGTF